jgi:peptide methionine sulfoxide reductase MsrA
MAPVAAAGARLPAADDVLIYVGAGCFWHVQHEMTVAEQKFLGRDGKSFTSVAGYAGGTKLGKNGKVGTSALLMHP